MNITRRHQLIAVTVAATSVLAAGIAASAASGGRSATIETPVAHVVDTVPTDVVTTVAADEAEPAVALSDQSRPTTPEPPVASEPDDEIDEPVSPGAPGVVDLVAPVEPPPPPPIGGPTDLIPVPKDPPPPPPIPGPVDLAAPPPSPDPVIDDFVAPIDPTPFDGPTDFQVVPLPGYLGEITSGLSGCQLECVQSAILTANDFNPSVHLAVETTVPVHFEVEVTKTGTDSSKFFNNPGYDTEWSTTLTPLQPDTTYDLTLIAIDQDGHSKVYEHQFTTVDVIDGFAGNAQGCALHCLTEGSVNMTDSFSKVQVHLESNSPAALTVWVSTSEPGSIGDIPVLPADAIVFDQDNTAMNWTFDVPGLAGDTEYHIVVRAEDAWGVDHRVGTFHTDEEPPTIVRIAFERIHVLYDGDSGEFNKGELSFSWGFDGIPIGHRNEEKMHAGKVITLGGEHAGLFAVSDELTIPTVGVDGSERDWDGLVEFCSTGIGIASGPSYNADCDTKTNAAHLGAAWTIGDLEGLPTCASMGEDVGGPSTRCAWIGTPNEGDDYARFNVLISFTF